VKRREILVLALLVGWFLYFARPGLRAWFSGDDLMNLAGVQGKTVGAIALSLDRPVPNLVYKGLYATFGFHPRPYRYFSFVLLAANLVLAFALIRKLSGSLVVAAFAGLLFAYHAQLADLYFSTGTLYDILCFLFYSGALLWYLTIRLAGRALNWKETAGLTALAVLAMGSKEMAVSLPLMLALTEFLYGDRRCWRVPLLSAGVCGAMLAGVLWATSMTANAAYRPEFTLAVYQARWHNYLSQMLYRGGDWPVRSVWVTLAVVAALAVAVRRKEAWWALGLVFVASVPMLFVPQRSLYAFCLPYFGFCLLAGCVLGRLARLAWPAGAWGPALALATLAIWLYPNHQFIRRYSEQWVGDWDTRVAVAGNTLRHNWPKLAPGAKVYFVDDPFPGGDEGDWTLLYIVRLASGDPKIEVWRERYTPQRVAEAEWGRFAAVFSLSRERLTRVR
jgi:hypothetical protein